MRTAFRSEGWIVRPSFVPNGPTSPVTLLGDEEGLTQLVGDPAVAWQTPWSELSNVHLVRFARSMALFATADGVRYSWRTTNRSDFDVVAAVLAPHGARVVRRRRRAGVYVAVLVVLVASLAGGIGAYFSKGSASTTIIDDTKAVNLSARDLPSGFAPTSESLLSDLFSTPNKVITSTTVTTAPPAKTSTWGQISAFFQRCVGVTAAKDRMYGAAGQQPDYQVSSPVFSASTNGGEEVASAAQYYRTTTMVKKDTTEMTNAKFGACFAETNAALLESVYAKNYTHVPVATNWRPVTFERGFSRGGVETLHVPGVTGSLYLVFVQITGGHYEVTLGALVSKWPKDQSFVSTLVSTLLARMNSSTSTAT